MVATGVQLVCQFLLFALASGSAIHTGGQHEPTQRRHTEVFGTSEREAPAAIRLAKAKCDVPVNKDDLDLGIKIGSAFLVKSQRDAGNFRYEYDWVSQKETDEDNPVRQAGTLWGLSLLHVDEPKKGLLPSLRKGFRYFANHSVALPGGRRMIVYPGQDPQKIGAVALLALSHIEVLRRPEELEGAAEKEALEAQLEGYLKFILAARTKRNNFFKSYNGKTGKSFGPSSPYFDGECLLALVKAAKYLGHDHLWPHIKVSAEAGYRKNVLLGLKMTEGKKVKAKEQQKQEAKARMKGYYQWSNMAWYELLGLKDPEFSKFGKRQLRFSDWLVSSHHSMDVNTGYAFEGIIPAFITAVREGDHKLEQKFACFVRAGVDNLHSLQVGHPKARGLGGDNKKAADLEPASDEFALGGVQGSRDAPGLRIDTTQHQLHALLMAKRLLQQQALI